MRALLAVILTLGVCGFLLLHGPCTLFQGSGHGPYEKLALPALMDGLAREHARRDALGARVQALARCREMKDRVIEELLRGDTDLLRAAAAFRALQRQVPDFDWEWFRFVYPGDSEEESICLAVIFYAEVTLVERAVEPAPVVARLRGELKAHKEHGPLRLPTSRPERQRSTASDGGEPRQCAALGARQKKSGT